MKNVSSRFVLFFLFIIGISKAEGGSLLNIPEGIVEAGKFYIGTALHDSSTRTVTIGSDASYTEVLPQNRVDVTYPYQRKTRMFGTLALTVTENILTGDIVDAHVAKELAVNPGACTNTGIAAKVNAAGYVYDTDYANYGTTPGYGSYYSKAGCANDYITFGTTPEALYYFPSYSPGIFPYSPAFGLKVFLLSYNPFAQFKFVSSGGNKSLYYKGSGGSQVLIMNGIKLIKLDVGQYAPGFLSQFVSLSPAGIPLAVKVPNPKPDLKGKYLELNGDYYTQYPAKPIGKLYRIDGKPFYLVAFQNIFFALSLTPGVSSYASTSFNYLAPKNFGRGTGSASYSLWIKESTVNGLPQLEYTTYEISNPLVTETASSFLAYFYNISNPLWLPALDNGSYCDELRSPINPYPKGCSPYSN